MNEKLELRVSVCLFAVESLVLVNVFVGSEVQQRTSTKAEVAVLKYVYNFDKCYTFQYDMKSFR